jgi:hypothetical protein
MIIEEQRRWWNRRVPILPIGAVAGFALLGLLIWARYGDFAQNAHWSVRHQRTASFRGQKLQLPWFWREKEWTNYNEFELTRSYSGSLLDSSVTATYENFAPADVQKKIDALQGLFAKLSQRQGGVTERDDFTDPHFVCMDEKSRLSQFLFETCLSRDGRWRVTTIGLKPSRPDFEMILRGVASMGTPSK